MKNKRTKKFTMTEEELKSRRKRKEVKFTFIPYFKSEYNSILDMKGYKSSI